MNAALLLGAAYVWTEIVIPGKTVGSAFGLNDHGQTAVGTADGAVGIYRNGVFTPLPAPPAGLATPGPTGINNAGVVVGGIFPASGTGTEQGFILHGTTYTLFSRPGWDNTEARAVSNSGIVTGYSYSSDFTAFAGFIYDPAANTFTDATPPGSGRGFSVTQGMNRHGRITGDGRLPGLGRYAFVWQQGAISEGKSVLRAFLDRVKIDGMQSAGRGINDSGAIVGFAGDAAGTSSQGFVGSAARGYQLLTVPGGDAPNSTICEGINNFAQVVCGANDPDGNPLGSFIGTPGDDEGGGD